MSSPDTIPSAAAASAATPPAAEGKKPRQKESLRDTVESILFAFVLAFLFRTFEAEAFVIPTGSMAPTLYGRHKDSACTQCGSRVVVGASHEVNPRNGLVARNSRLTSAVCWNCGYNNKHLFDALAFNGDRILVDKYPYEFGEPDRWDVFVFKFPEEPETNYIKRLVGLPSETIRIRRGNLYRVENGAESILRKSPDKQRILQIPVYDDDHPPSDLLRAGWPERWSATGGSWKPGTDSRTYSIEAAATDWLRYSHITPMPSDWATLEQGGQFDPRPRLVGDFCGYNSGIQEFVPIGTPVDHVVDFGAFWVPDLTINFDLKIESLNENAELAIELREGTSWYRARINPRSGQVVLEEINTQLNQRVRELGQGNSPITGPGTYSISFANVDDRLALWVNNRLIDLGDGAEITVHAVDNPFPTPDDLSPVGIGARGMNATVSHLKLERDIYYRAAFPERDRRNQDVEQFQVDLMRYVRDPEKWSEVYQQHADALDQRTIEVEADHFLALGDNSPQSKDSRMWEEEIDTVPRNYLVGKAFWIYWPHGVPFLNGGKGFPIVYNYEQNGSSAPIKLKDYPRYTLPFYPQVDRMKRIR